MLALITKMCFAKLMGYIGHGIYLGVGNNNSQWQNY